MSLACAYDRPVSLVSYIPRRRGMFPGRFYQEDYYEIIPYTDDNGPVELRGVLEAGMMLCKKWETTLYTAPVPVWIY